MVNNRLQMTQTVMNALTDMATELKVPFLPGIRTDTALVKAARSKMFLGLPCLVRQTVKTLSTVR